MYIYIYIYIHIYTYVHIPVQRPRHLVHALRRVGNGPGGVVADAGPKGIGLHFFQVRVDREFVHLCVDGDWCGLSWCLVGWDGVGGIDTRGASCVVRAPAH